MFIKQIYTQCLAEASYFIESNGEAVVIDPVREAEPYIALAKERNATIKYIFETHFHADFVSGHLELAKKTGAKITFGPGATTNFASVIASDGEQIKIGDIYFKVLHTPGHTPESTTFLLVDESGKNHAIFTGDTLFIGDVGRPDLAISSQLTSEDLAGMLFDSIQQKILPLEDDVVVYPGHGAGSACGKNISKETFATLGNQKQTNYALQITDKTAFVQVLTDGILPAPSYFAVAAGINKNGYPMMDEIREQMLKPISPSLVTSLQNQGMLVLDTRTPDEFETGFIPGAINIGLNGQFAIWAATLLNYQTPLVIVSDADKINEVVSRLARVGIHNIYGFVEGGMEAWTALGLPTQQVKSIQPEEMRLWMDKGAKVLDVRKPGEFEAGHLANAQSVHLQILPENTHLINTETPLLIHCAGGYRSMIAASILQQKGYNNIINVRKGWSGIQSVDNLSFETGPCESQKREMLLNSSK